MSLYIQSVVRFKPGSNDGVQQQMNQRHMSATRTVYCVVRHDVLWLCCSTQVLQNILLKPMLATSAILLLLPAMLSSSTMSTQCTMHCTIIYAYTQGL